MESNKKNPFFLHYFIPVFLIISFIIGMGCIAFYISLREINRVIETSNRQIISGIKSSLDERLNQVGNLIFSFTEDRELMEYLNFNREEGGYSLYIQNRLCGKSKVLANYLDYLDDIFIFIDEKNTVLTKTSPYKWDSFMRIRLDDGNEISKYTNLGFSYLEFDNITYWDESLEEKKKSLCLNISLPLLDVNNPRALVSLVISNSLFKGFLDKGTLLSKGALFIINQRGETLIQVGNLTAVPYGQEELVSMLPGKGRTSIFAADHSLIMGITASDFKNLYYVTFIPERLFFNVSRYLQLVIAVFFLLSLILGAAYSLYFAWRKSMPLSRMYNSLVPDASERTLKGEGFSYMENRIREMKLTLTLQQPVIRENTGRKLLFSSYDHKLNDELDEVGFVFSHDFFCVALIRNSRQFYSSIKAESDIVDIIEKNLLEGSFELILGNDSLYVLCNLDSDSPAKYDALKNTFRAIQSEIQGKVDREYFISLGLIHRGLPEVSQSCEEAINAGNMGRFRLDKDIIDYSRLLRPNHRIIYPIDLERKLASALTAGDRGKAREALEGIMAHSFSENLISEENSLFLFYEIINTTLKIIRRLQEDGGIVFPQEFLPEQLLKDINSVTEMQSGMFSIIEKTCDLILEGNRNQKKIDTERFHTYLMKNYVDPNLDLEKMAFDFEYSSSYFSTYFMKIMNVNFKKYLTDCRIGKAMELFNNGCTSIDEVLRKVGYTNYMSFNRNFKKKYNLSPSVYIRKKENDKSFTG